MILQEPSIIRQYALAGRAILILKSTFSGTMFTYAINRPTFEDPAKCRQFFVYYKIMSIWKYFCYLDRQPHDVFKLVVFKRFQQLQEFKAFRYFFAGIIERNIIPPQLVINHDNRCGACRNELIGKAALDIGLCDSCAPKPSPELIEAYEDQPRPKRRSRKRKIEISEGMQMPDDDIGELATGEYAKNWRNSLAEKLEQLKKE